MTDEYLTGPKGTYRLLQRIGSGGMGIVHLALDEDGRTVAVKELHPSLIDDEMLRRLEREVTSMLRVSSPYVAEIRDADVRGPRPFVATRYVQGRALDTTVRDRGPLSGAGLVNVARRLATALEAIHAAGIVHRDLKPSNVMISEGDPVVIDFGIAQAIDATRLTHTGVVVGTPGYVAPEIVNGGVAEEPADVFAWAATVAYAATGRSPFGTGPAEVVFFRVVGGQSDLHGVPEPLLPVLRKALSRDPESRPTADTLSTLLTDLTLDPPDTPASAAPPAPATSTPAAPATSTPAAPATSAPAAATPPATAAPVPVPEAEEAASTEPAPAPAPAPSAPVTGAAEDGAARTTPEHAPPVPPTPAGPQGAAAPRPPLGQQGARNPSGPQAPQGWAAPGQAYGQAPGAYGQPAYAPQPQGGQAQAGQPRGAQLQGGQAQAGQAARMPPAQQGFGHPPGVATGRVGFGIGVLVVAGVTALAFVLPGLGLLVGVAGLVVLGVRDRIRPYGDRPAGLAVVDALWRTAAAYVVAAAVAWGLEWLLEAVAKPRISAGQWVSLRDTPSATVLAAFTALAVLLATAVPRWRGPSRALARMVTGGDGSAPIVRYTLMAVCGLAIVAALFAPVPSWWPVPIDGSITFGDVLP